jgi:hypothetical protein
VLDLFNKWDFNGNGAIEIAVLSSTGVSGALVRRRHAPCSPRPLAPSPTARAL